MLLLVGTHRSGPDAGFSLARFDPLTGKLGGSEFVQQAEAPSFFVVHPDGKHVYTCNSVDASDGLPEGAVSAYEIDSKTGRMRFLNRVPSGGAEPCYISLDGRGRFVLVANYNSGTVATFPILANGSLGKSALAVRHHGRSVHPQRQTTAHAHSIITDPSNRYALACDLGIDQVLVYRFDPATGSLKLNDPPGATLAPGSGPRHLEFGRDGRFLYVVNELTNSITVFRWDGTKGALSEVQTVATLPASFRGTSTAAEIRVHPSGKFLYATNRGENSIAVFRIEPATGRLSSIQEVASGGMMPRNFTFDPAGRWMIVENHDSDNLVVFEVDAETGLLKQVGGTLRLPNPFCARFLR